MAKQKVGYVDGFVLVVPKKKVAEYIKMARTGKKIWMKHGALDYKECMADHMHPPYVTFTFPKMAKAKKGEVVWFSYIGFKSKKHRDAVNAKVMKDPSMQGGDVNSMPFDMKRMAYGGFKVMVS